MPSGARPARRTRLPSTRPAPLPSPSNTSRSWSAWPARHAAPTTSSSSGAGCRRGGEESLLKREPGRSVWGGTAPRVPVNFPPRGEPYLVRIYDPHIVGGPTEGITADRLKVGGEALSRFYSPGNPYESGLVFIDQNGQGHSPF